MKQILIIFSLFIMASSLLAQSTEIKQTSIDELKNRVGSNSDTLYVVNFWATWCKPCVEEMPIIENIQSSYKGIPVKVILVSLDFPNQIKSRLIPFIEKEHILNEVLVLNESNPNEWIPKVDNNWSGAIPACWFYYKQNQNFHEGQVNPELISKLISKTVE